MVEPPLLRPVLCMQTSTTVPPTIPWPTARVSSMVRISTGGQWQLDGASQQPTPHASAMHCIAPTLHIRAPQAPCCKAETVGESLPAAARVSSGADTIGVKQLAGCPLPGA
jgi:hypothetical protein